ncbi:Transposase IS116/IS110/IS902 family protein [Wolbachia endosymbiont of Cylisticus convexus]|nr:Transposase IS116/IS110/IS902 family protein [Wolbachia endosymbiont of Cylisticus convexus]
MCVLRSYVRQRANLIENAAKHTQRMQKALIQMNIQLHKVISDINGVTGMKIIKAIIEGERDPEKLAEFRSANMKNDKPTIAKALTGDYREEHLFALKQEYAAYTFFQEQITECDKSIEIYYKTFETKSNENGKLNKTRKKRKNSPDFAIDEDLYRITGMDFTKVPGFDVLSIQTIISETGINHNKWPTEKHFSSWLGLSPANKITGEKIIGTRTRKVVNRTATALRLAAHCVSRSNTALGAYCRRLKKRLGIPKAITATARKLACIFYNMLKYGQEYVEKGIDYYEKLYQDRMMKNLSKKAREFGYILVKNDELIEGVC